MNGVNSGSQRSMAYYPAGGRSRKLFRYNLAQMKFAKIIFYLAAVWGILILTPLYFMFDLIGRQDPPPITHPAFYYGFAGAALAWQLVFIVIARDPVRFRLMMLPSLFEKFSYGAALLALYVQHRLHGADVAFGCIDILFGVMFLVAYARTSELRA